MVAQRRDYVFAAGHEVETALIAKHARGLHLAPIVPRVVCDDRPTGIRELGCGEGDSAQLSHRRGSRIGSAHGLIVKQISIDFQWVTSECAATCEHH